MALIARDEAVRREMLRATEKLTSLIGDELSTVSIQSEAPDEAVFLGQNISKLSPIIGNLLERRVIHTLTDETSTPELRWERQDPGFPDALLVDQSGQSTGAGFEIKAWYALSTEITGRFKESARLLASKDIKLVIIPWTMSHVVYGRPVILDVLIVDATEIAQTRDLHYHNPPDYLCEEPQNTSARTKNLQQTNVNGYKLQDQHKKNELETFCASHQGVKKISSTDAAQKLVKELMNKADYRLDTNFAKIDRIDHDAVEKCKSRVLALSMHGKSNNEWRRLLKSLAEDGESETQEAARLEIARIYNPL